MFSLLKSNILGIFMKPYICKSQSAASSDGMQQLTMPV